MVISNMSFQEMQNIYLFNCARRESLLAEALKKETPEMQMKFVADYFLNKLPLETIAQIDCVDEKQVIPFQYDYSYLEDYSSEQIRNRTVRKYGVGRYGTNLPQADVDNRNGDKIRIYPSMYAVKMGTCIMFASEVQRFSHDFGIPCEIVNSIEYCYDNFDGKCMGGGHLTTDRLVKMSHFYNVLTIDGKKVKLDIAGALTAADFNKNHPSLEVDEKEFCFSEKTVNNPFKKHVKKSTYAINLPSELPQPQ